MAPAASLNSSLTSDSLKEAEVPSFLDNLMINRSQTQQAQDHHMSGEAFTTSNEYDKAIEEYKKALAIPEHLGNARACTHNSLGVAYQQMGKHDEAIKELKKALAISEYLGKGRAKTHHSLGSIYGGMGKYDEAIEEYKKALTIQEHLGNARASTHLKLELAYAETKQDVQSMAEYLEILKLRATFPFFEEAVRKMRNVCERISPLSHTTNSLPQQGQVAVNSGHTLPKQK